MSHRVGRFGFQRRARDLWVIVGAHGDIERHQTSQRRHQVRRAVIHGSYSRRTHLYDIALLQLKRGIKFNDRARPICVDDSVFPPETECVVTGWGLTTYPSGMHVVICYAILIVIVIYYQKYLQRFILIDFHTY